MKENCNHTKVNKADHWWYLWKCEDCCEFLSNLPFVVVYYCHRIINGSAVNAFITTSKLKLLKNE
jgi:hypothetical protein